MPGSGSSRHAASTADWPAFLNRMAAAGYLVAATRLATEDDTSVAGGFLDVTVRPWQVMMHTR
jgi:hypothetical protein